MPSVHIFVDLGPASVQFHATNAMFRRFGAREVNALYKRLGRLGRFFIKDVSPLYKRLGRPGRFAMKDMNPLYKRLGRPG